MVEANLIDYSVDTTSHDDARAGRIFSCIIRGITWEGHDLLDAIRNDTVWSRTLEKIKPLESVAVDVLKQVAVGISLKILGV